MSSDDPATFHHLKYSAPHDLVRIEAIYSLSIERNLPPSHFAILAFQEAGDSLERGGFSRTVGSEQSNDSAPWDIKAQSPQDENDIVVNHLDILDGQQGFNVLVRHGKGLVAGIEHTLVLSFWEKLPPVLRREPFASYYQPSHSALRGRVMTFTFSSLIVPFFIRSGNDASVAPETLVR